MFRVLRNKNNNLKKIRINNIEKFKKSSISVHRKVKGKVSGISEK